MKQVPHGVWMTGGSPDAVRSQVEQAVADAAAKERVAVLVAYDIPGRDCSGYSSGGSQNSVQYQAWIDGFARGIGDGNAIVILEPDSLGLLPSNCGVSGRDAERYAQLNLAVDRLAWQPNARVYLDGTHSHWLTVDEAAKRLQAAGYRRARGFFLNVSNYQTTNDLILYGRAISDKLGGAHFVIDTSRNGRGPWHPTHTYPDAQDWCNPPGRGLGMRPATSTGVDHLDAYLWVKVPGESDGSCNRGIAGSRVDPEWAAITGDANFVDPPAGQWFPQQARQLAELADPPLR